jgi:CubicO group peptidase (beta-lactamase class C family)/tetratricopeptide (TPR) repeat protein
MPSVQKGQNMRCFTWLLVALCIFASTLYAAHPNGQQLSTSEKQQAGKQGTQNPEAYALYLKGRSYWARRTRADFETAVSYFNQAIAKDPGYAMAYAGLADCYAMLPDYGASVEDIPKAKAAALKAIELDPTLSRSHVNLGGTKMAHDWDFAGGEAEFKKALELDPNDSHAHQRYANNLKLLGGREQDALTEINRAHQLDPGSLTISVDVGMVYTYARRFDEAIAVCQKVANENPTFADAHNCLAYAYWGTKMYSHSIEESEAYGKLTGERSDSDYAAALEQGFRSGGWKGALSQSIETLKAQRNAGYSVTYEIAAAYAELGDKEEAFQWLNTAFQEHDEDLMSLKTDFTLDPIRSDPRFAELVRKVGLPQQDTQDPEAHALYLQGCSYWAKRTLSDLETAVSYFNQAIAKDPSYALAYASLASAYAVMPDYGGSPSEDVPKANAAARKALELDATLGRPHAAVGYTKFVHDWDFVGGEAEFKKAIALDPNDATAQAWYAENIGTIGGRGQEALAGINRAHQLDPLSAVISRDLGTNLIFARQYDDAIAVCEKLANENPTFAMGHECLANAYWGKKMYPQVIEEWKTYGKLSGDQSDSDYAIATEQGFRSAGWKGALRRGIEASLAQRKAGGSSAYGIAELYADLGEKDQAFQWLNTAFQEHDQLLIGLKTDFTLDSLRSDPRFAELVRKVGLPPTPAPDETFWPTNAWATASPASVGLDEQVLLKLEKDMASGKYSQLMDSFAVFRCGKKVFERTYPRDYAELYAKEAGERGAYNERLTGRYNYFDSYWHPYYHGTDLHTMQSISKTVTSIIIGAAIQRGDFKAALDTPVLKYFDTSKVKNVDDRKRRMTLRDLLTMTAGLDWNAEGFITGSDPQNDTSLMEGSDDWVQYAIDKPMVAEPGKVWNYNDGATEVLAYIFQKETGQDIDDYGQKYLFAPLGMRHEWKRSYLGLLDTEGGLYLNGSDLAKIGYLYLHDGMWDGQRIVSSEWVKKSLTPYFQTPAEPESKDGFKFGFKWWLLKLPDSTEYVWMARGFGGQNLEVFPEEGLIVTFTMWDILPSSTGTEPTPSDFLPLVKTKTCTDAVH